MEGKQVGQRRNPRLRASERMVWSPNSSTSYYVNPLPCLTQQLLSQHLPGGVGSVPIPCSMLDGWSQRTGVNAHYLLNQQDLSLSPGAALSGVESGVGEKGHQHPKGQSEIWKLSRIRQGCRAPGRKPQSLRDWSPAKLEGDPSKLSMLPSFDLLSKNCLRLCGASLEQQWLLLTSSARAASREHCQ